jgi:putative ABC transport system permease protein
MDTFWQDIRYGIRMLMKKPGFTVVAVMTLALGIGANTAIFSVVNGVLLRPLPYKDAERIMTLWQTNVKSGVAREQVAPANFLDWRERQTSFERMAVIFPWGFDITEQGEPETIRSWAVTEGFFEILGVNALHGRTFRPEEFQPGNERVVVLGSGLWQQRFGGALDVIGQKLILDRQPYTVVGILPPQVKVPAERQMWSPKVFDEHDRRERQGAYCFAIARLKPNLTVAQAQQEMNAIAAQLAEEHPRTNQDRGIAVVSLPEQMVSQVRPALLVLLGAVGLVLLIACANVANLLLARGTERRKEFAVRAALGAGRSRLVRQLLTESVGLALCGCVGGLLLAGWGVDAILALSPDNLPRAEEIKLDGVVFGFAVGVSVLTALVFGLFPALQFSKPDLQETLKDGGRTTGGVATHRLRQGLIVAETALALMLLVGAGLLMRSFVRLLQVNPGFSPDNVVALEVFVWEWQRTPDERAVYFQETINRIAALPGVKSVGAVSLLPFLLEDTIDVKARVIIAGQPTPPPGQEPTAYSTIATTDYFRTMAIPLVRGRFFTRFDNAQSAPVALINETMARRLWPDEDPVGKKITVSSFGPPKEREIVGIVGDVRHAGLDADAQPEYFVPHAQSPFGSMTFVVRTEIDPQTLLPAIKNQIWAAEQDQPFYNVVTMEQLVTKSLGERRFSLFLLGSFAAFALVLATIGIYGVMAYAVTQRTGEIGIRLVLGAKTSEVVRLIVGQGMRLVVVGVGIGLVGAIGLTRVLTNMLYGVSANDPLTFAGLALLLTGVGFVANYVPARRATKVDPMVALRYE